MLHVQAQTREPGPNLNPVKASLYTVIAASPLNAIGSV